MAQKGASMESKEVGASQAPLYLLASSSKPYSRPRKYGAFGAAVATDVATHSSPQHQGQLYVVGAKKNGPFLWSVMNCAKRDHDLDNPSVEISCNPQGSSCHLQIPPGSKSTLFFDCHGRAMHWDIRFSLVYVYAATSGECLQKCQGPQTLRF